MSNPKRPGDISKRAWALMQYMRSGETIWMDDKTGEALTMSGPVPGDVFCQMRDDGLIERERDGHSPNWRLSARGHDLAAGDVVEPAAPAPEGEVRP